LSSQVKINQFSGDKNFNDQNLNTSNDVLNISIFYKEDYDEKCDKSKILTSNQKCNCKDFKAKLESITSNVKNHSLTINIYSIDDSYFNFKGKKVSLMHLTALIKTENDKLLNVLSKYKSKDYIKVRDSNYTIPNKIFDYENKYETHDKALELDKFWFGLYTAKSENKGGMCPVYDIPKEDLFLNYLSLVLDEINEIQVPVSVLDTGILNKIISKIDSLNFNLNNKVNEITQKLDKYKNGTDTSKPKFLINLGFSLLNVQKLESTQGLYQNQMSSATMPLIYVADFEYWIQTNFRVGLGYAYSRYRFNNSLGDNNYSTDWYSEMLNNTGQLNIYARNLKESFSFEHNNFNLTAGYSKRFPVGKSNKNHIGFDLDLGLGYILPFILRSRLTDATINSRGKLNGIVDELMNIAELGLIENDRSAIGKESELRMQGNVINIGANLVYEYKNICSTITCAFDGRCCQ
jgi:hypothetical protein